MTPNSHRVADRYHLDDLPAIGRASLTGDLAHYLRRVVRAAPGQTVVLFDGRGREAVAVVVGLEGRSLAIDVREVRQAPQPARRSVVVAFSPPRAHRMAEILEHGTELGVAGFHPLAMQHTPRAQRQAGDVERWRRIVAAAAGQCGAVVLPRVAPVQLLADFEAKVLVGFEGERWLARPSGWRPARNEPPERLPPALVVVGPEGGLTDAEVESLHAAGCHDLGLGPHVLRVETAVLAAAVRLLLAAPMAP